jgi:monoamine oxidase
MPKPRGREHSSLTETAGAVVYELKKISGIKMIAPGEIRTNKKSSSTRYVTASYTAGGFELLISGQSIQKVAIHTEGDPRIIFATLKTSKKLQGFIFKERERKPGI